MSRPLRVVIGLMGIVVVLSACASGLAGSSSPSDTGPRTPTAEAIELTLYAAASLRDVLAAVNSAYRAAVPGVTLTIATDSSSTLRTQIEQGAPADVFLSADRHNPQALADAGLTNSGVVDFASNGLTIIVPADNPAGIASPADLARPGVKVIAAGDSVPITAYAREVVARLATLPGYPVDFAATYSANVVSKEENVKAVVAKVELGEGDAAIVYATDANASSKVQTIDMPPEAEVLASYAGVVIRASIHPAQAHSFLDWLAGPHGAAILARFGFRALS